MIRIVLGCLSLSFTFAGLFAADLLGYFSRTSKPVAIVTESQGTVRRLPQGELIWNRSNHGTLLGVGDTIATGEDARARVNLYAGADLELDAGAMVVIAESLDELKLNFIAGSGKLQVTEKAKQKVRVVEERAGVRRARPSVAVEVVAKLPPVAVKAAAPPPPPKSLAPPIQVREIKHPERALASSGELATAQALPPVPRIKFPAPDAIIDLGRVKAADLEWETPVATNAASLGYEVVLRPATSPGEELIFRSDRPRFPLARVASGKYLWAVRSVSATGRRGPASEARSIELRAPVHLSKPVPLPVRVE